MAKKKDNDFIDKAKFWNDMREETRKAIMAILSFLIMILSLLAAFGKAGPVGEYGYQIFTKLFGVGYFLIPIVCALVSIALLQGIEKKFRISKTIGAILFFFSSLGLINIMKAGAGGIIGGLVARPLIRVLAVGASTILLLVLIIVSVFMLFEAGLTWEQLSFWRIFMKKVKLGPDGKPLKKGVNGKISDSEEEKIDRALANAKSDANEEGSADQKTARDLAIEEAIERVKKQEEKKKTAMRSGTGNGASNSGTNGEFEGEDGAFSPAIQVPLLKPFTPPPLSLLEKDRGKPETGDIKANANIIKRTLQNFGITVEMDEISIGPSVTRYALKPAEGVKLSRIVGLNNDLALALAAHPIRIEAPIPGKSLVGIEVPNTAKTTVGLATLLGAAEYQNSEKPLFVSLGKDIAGKAHFCNLAKAPHILVAGATGSGKSVTIHALVTSLLYRNSPENMKFIMIDPKRVELTMYNKIPHLLTPVITDPKKAILALKWAAKEMSRRYDALEKTASRDIDSYHKNVLAPAVKKMIGRAADAGTGKNKNSDADDEKTTKLPETMPYIVIVIDELADIMQTYPRELEAAIVRLAQMSRAVGIHLVISTQRPSVNVITGLIKANIPTRVALQVASQIDSRTILDQMGAEKLLGAGDMLYLGGEMSKPVRLQSAYIGESEVKSVVKYLINEYRDEIMGEINLAMSEPGKNEPGAGAAFGSKVALGTAAGAPIDITADSMGLNSASLDDEDDMYEPAREAVISAGKASTSYIQRKLGIGYSRAAKLMDILEERGVIGPANGSKPREIMGGGESSGSSSADGDSDGSNVGSGSDSGDDDDGSTVPEEI